MANDILVRMTLNSKQLVTGLKQSGQHVKNFQSQTEKASRGTKMFGSAARDLGNEFGITQIGLSAVVGTLSQFTTGAIQAADETRKVSSAFVNLSGGSEQARANMEAVAAATSIAGRQVVDETSQMQIANQLLSMNIAATSEELEKVISVSRRLGAEFKGLGAKEAAEEFAIMISNMSVARLDSFGIASGRVKQRIDELIKSGQAASREDAFFQATMEEAETTLNRLGPELDSIAAATAESGAAFDNFQGSFGELLLSVSNNMGIFETFTSAMEKLNEGAQAWTFVVTEAIPAIRGQREEIDQWAGSTLAAADSLEEMTAATEGNISDFETFRAALASSVGTYEAYRSKVNQITKATEGSGTQLELYARSLGLTEQEFRALRTAVDQERIAQMQATRGVDQASMAYENLQDPLRQTTTGLIDQIDPLLRLQQEWQDYSDQIGDVGAQLAEVMGGPGFKGLGLGDAALESGVGVEQTVAKLLGQNEAGGGFGFESMKEKAEDAAKAISDSFESAFNNLKSVVDSVAKPSLEEVYTPPVDDANFDEDARRLATVATSGFGSEWLNQLSTQFEGQDFFQPVLDAMQAGDEGALKEAAAAILDKNVTALWDADLIKERVRTQIEQSNLREEFLNAITAELAGEGVAMPAEENPLNSLFNSMFAGLGVAGEGGEGEGGAAGGIGAAVGPMVEGMRAAFSENIPGFVEETQSAVDNLTLALVDIGETTLPGVSEAHQATSDEMNLAFGGIQEKSKQTGDSIKGDFERAGNAMKANFPIAENLVRHLQSIEEAARRAASAIRSVKMGGGGGSFEGFVEEAGARGLQLSQVN